MCVTVHACQMYVKMYIEYKCGTHAFNVSIPAIHDHQPNWLLYQQAQLTLLV